MKSKKRLSGLLGLLGLMLLAVDCAGGPILVRPPPEVPVSPTLTPQVGLLSTLVVSGLFVSKPLPVSPGETIGIWVDVDKPTGVELEYQWTTHPEGKGEILDGQSTSAITYRVPTEPGSYQVRVEVTAPGVVFKGRVSIIVENAHAR